VLDCEIGRIVQLGLDCHCNCVVGRDVPLADLSRSYQAIFFANGLLKPAQLQLVTREDGVVWIGELPENVAQGRQETTEVSLRVNNSVSLAIAQGLAVGKSLVSHFNGEAAGSRPSVPVIGSGKMKLAWYPAMESFGEKATDGQEPAAEVGLSETEAIVEAKRCLSCGMCMDCESCWMYCTPHCIEKLPKGEHYKLKLDSCNGCGKCAETCPCGFIEMI